MPAGVGVAALAGGYGLARAAISLGEVIDFRDYCQADKTNKLTKQTAEQVEKLVSNAKITGRMELVERIFQKGSKVLAVLGILSLIYAAWNYFKD